MLPVGVVFKEWLQQGAGLLAFGEIAVFVLILLLGLIYVWAKGDLEWVKKVEEPAGALGTEMVPRASKV